MRRGFLGVLPIAAIAAWLAASCLEPTQITVDVRTTFACSNVETIMMVGGVDVTTKTMPPYTATTNTCKGPNAVGKLVVVPRSSSAGAVYVRIVAGVQGTTAAECVDPGHAQTAKCIEARRVIRFLSHRKLELPITLDEACINKICPPRTTCDRGECIPEDVCTGMCPDAGDDAGTDFDAGADTGAVDAGPPPTAVLLAAGFENACALADDKKLYCWGDNSMLQLGSVNAMEVGPIAISLPQSFGNVKEMAVGNQFICVDDGKYVACLGSDSFGQLGDGQQNTKSSKALIVPLTGTSGVSSLVGGDSFACVREGSGQFTCWGNDGTKNDYSKPATLSGDPGLVVVAAGSWHGCGFDVANVTWCWGLNAAGEIGLDPKVSPDSNTPLSIGVTKNVSIAAGFHHSGGAFSQKTKLWGANTFGEIDMQTMPNPVYTPTDTGGPLADQLAFGEGHVCQLLLAQNKVQCRGTNAEGQLTGKTLQSSTWIDVTLNGNPIAIAAGRAHSCALTVGGHVYCWGAAPAGPGSASPTEVILPP